jgi:tetrapyrrole methylase family protein/MazG family protein
MRIIHLPPGPIAAPLAEELRSGRVVLSSASAHAEESLKAIEVDFAIAQGEADGDILVIPARPLDELVQVVDRLLGPGGCPWDQAQTHESLKKYLLEETYEVFDAIDSGSTDKLREELGDLLLQPILHAQMQDRDGNFSSDDVAAEIIEKLIRRHPHVFGEVIVADEDEVLRNWDRIKQTEKGGEPKSILAGVPRSMASLLRAHEVSKRAVRVGFEWANLDDIFAKLDEEILELREAIHQNSPSEIQSELGDVLFTMVNIGRWLKVEPEDALRKMLDRFTARFQHMEARSTKPLDELSAEEWDALWNQAKLATAVEK